MLWWSAPGLSALCLALTAGAAARTLALVTTGQLVGALPDAIANGLGSPAAGTAWQWLVAAALLFVAAPPADAARTFTVWAISARYLVTVLDLTMEAGTHPYGIAHLEEPRSAGRLEAVAQAPQDWLFLDGVDAAWTLLSIRLSGVGAVVVLASWSWWAPLLLVAGWLVFGRWSGTLFDELLDGYR